jgi:hypothetical protein
MAWYRRAEMSPLLCGSFSRAGVSPDPRSTGLRRGFPSRQLSGGAISSSWHSRLRRTADPPINRKYRFTGYHRWLDPDGYPAIAPPWGTLSAIDLNSGDLCLEDSARRISGTRGERHEEHRNRKL